MPDQEITCAECGTSFPFTEREQEYYRNAERPFLLPSVNKSIIASAD